MMYAQIYANLHVCLQSYLFSNVRVCWNSFNVFRCVEALHALDVCLYGLVFCLFVFIYWCFLGVLLSLGSRCLVLSCLVCVFACGRLCLCMHVRMFVCVCMSVFVHVWWMFVHVCLCLSVSMVVHGCLCLCVYVCMRVCVCEPERQVARRESMQSQSAHVWPWHIMAQWQQCSLPHEPVVIATSEGVTCLPSVPRSQRLQWHSP